MVGARARNRLDLNAGGSPLGDVEVVGDDLKFSDRFTTEARLAEPDDRSFCLICWPSRLKLNDSFWPMPGELVTLFDVTPFTSIESSSQLRPCNGIASICRRSTLPATWLDVRSTSGDSPVTVTVSRTAETVRVKFIDAFWPTSSSTRGTSAMPKPESSACTR